MGCDTSATPKVPTANATMVSHSDASLKLEERKDDEGKAKEVEVKPDEELSVSCEEKVNTPTIPPPIKEVDQHKIIRSLKKMPRWCTCMMSCVSHLLLGM